MAADKLDASNHDPSKAEEENPFFFEATLSSIPNPISQVLESYSGIPQAEQIDHVLRVRDRAYASKRYPCLGRFRFLQLDLAERGLYKDYIVPHLTQKRQVGGADPIFLDLGTCLGQDLRKLVVDGVSPKQLYGADIESEFIESGYELFRDKDKFPADHFICPADVFDTSPEAKLNQLDNRVDILQVSSVFHLFGQDQQAPVAQRCLRLLRKDTGDKVLVIGAQVGNINPSDFVRPSGTKRYRHNESSWARLWESVCDSDEWKDRIKDLDVQVRLLKRPASDGTGKDEERNKFIGSLEEGFRWMLWSVWVEFHPAA